MHEYTMNKRVFVRKLGKKVANEMVTIYDDPLNKDAFPIPFDFEGYPKQKTTIIEKGILKVWCTIRTTLRNLMQKILATRSPHQIRRDLFPAPCNCAWHNL